jgi:hypothetical protein
MFPDPFIEMVNVTGSLASTWVVLILADKSKFPTLPLNEPGRFWVGSGLTFKTNGFDLNVRSMVSKPPNDPPKNSSKKLPVRLVVANLNQV